ncbi:restriction endonuclease subunit S [Kribbella sp. NPDC050470]|uniref:restriction endonuclease subunit S n=1 Tax=unclassified Kribbella TaxID=2644121 RepID=UPI0037AA1555
MTYGNKLDMNKMTRADRLTGIAFVGRKGGLDGHSGVSGFVQPVPGLQPYQRDLLTVALGGSRLLSSYVQQRPFYTAQNVAVLEPLDSSMPLLHRLYYAMCIRRNAFRYTAFGREANRTLGTIQLPDLVPDWVDKAQIPTVAGLAKSAAPHVPLGDPTAWASFVLGDLFSIYKGRRLTKAARLPGGVRFIGASEKNNGITDMNDVSPTFQGGCLTVPYNGNSVGWAFYQDAPFFACDDVNVLVPKTQVSKWSLLFVAAVIKHLRFRYTYGYKWTLERMQTTSINLPGTTAGEPDWQFMESVMLGLPFSGSLGAEAG